MNSLLLADSNIFPRPYSKNSSTKVILVRHGRTTYNEQGRYQGSSDESVLTEQGHRDAYATGLALQQYDFDGVSALGKSNQGQVSIDAIYTSPLTRVQQTTQEIVSALNSPNIPVYVEPRLTEVCMSDWQGLSYQEVKEKYPDAYKCWQSTPHLFTRNQINYPVLDLFEQAKAFWQSILKKHRGQTILLVAHGGTNRALIGTAIALHPQHYHSLQQCNCGISCLEFPLINDELGKLKYLNVTHHLGKQLPKLKAGNKGWRWLLVSNKVSTKNLKSSWLSKAIKQDLINLVLTEDSQKSKELAIELLEKDNKTLHLSISNNIFLHSWQQTINNFQNSELFTGLIVAPDELISQILRQTIDIESSLDLTNNIAIVHYPQLEGRSILQGLFPLRSNFNQDLEFSRLSSEGRAIAR